MLESLILALSPTIGTPTLNYQLDYQQKCWQWLRTTLNYQQHVSQESLHPKQIVGLLLEIQPLGEAISSTLLEICNCVA